MIEQEWNEMAEKIRMNINALQRDVHIHCDKHGGIVTFDFFDDTGDAKSYEFIN